jgi:hypothetical protein
VEKHGKTCKQIETILHLNIATRFNVLSKPFLKKGERKPKRSKAEKERAQCVALSSRDRASLYCSNAVACYMEGTKTVSDSKRNTIGVLKAYGGSGGTYPLYLKIASIWISVVSLRP